LLLIGIRLFGSANQKKYIIISFQLHSFIKHVVMNNFIYAKKDGTFMPGQRFQNMYTRSTISPISIKWATTSHLNSLNTKMTTTYNIGNPDPGLEQAQIYLISMFLFKFMSSPPTKKVISHPQQKNSYSIENTIHQFTVWNGKCIFVVEVHTSIKS